MLAASWLIIKCKFVYRILGLYRGEYRLSSEGGQKIGEAWIEAPKSTAPSLEKFSDCKIGILWWILTC